MRESTAFAIAAFCLLNTGMAVAGPAEKLPNEFEVQGFLYCDQDADLKLNFEEFRAFLDLMARIEQPKAKWVVRLNLYSVAFSTVDKNSDALVDPAELLAADSD